MTNKREHIDIENEDSTFWKQYNLIRKMREEEDGVAFNAPVDTVGCAHLGTPPDETLAPDVVEQQRKTFRFQTLLALMLSSQTKDGIVALAMGKLKNHGCTVDNIAETTSETLAKLIHPVGFYKKKSEYIRKVAIILRDQYNGDIPPDLKSLTSLPGVGPKMAYLTMTMAWKQIIGIGVDTHVHRISNRLNWVTTTTPEKTRTALEEWLPRTEWKRINDLLVGFGQMTCTPTHPKCQKCLLQESDICPFYTNVVKVEQAKKKKGKKTPPKKVVGKRKKIEYEEETDEEDIEDLIVEIKEEDGDNVELVPIKEEEAPRRSTRKRVSLVDLNQYAFKKEDKL